MKSLSLLAYVFGIYSVVAHSRGQSSRSSVMATLDACQQLQMSIHADVVLINSIISQAADPSSGANETASMDAMTSAFEHMISSIKSTTTTGTSNKPIDRATDFERRDDISEVVFGIFGVVQAIVADLATAIGKSLGFFNHSEVVMSLSALLVQALLGLINGLLVPLVTSPFGEQLRQLINSVIKLIPI